MSLVLDMVIRTIFDYSKIASRVLKHVSRRVFLSWPKKS